ncbi:hypothetical protein Sjap_023764 [Stephania japonica]|uniref:TFIIS N-terminal domain-containing protein n=1 Tax=Stephania japonica TaxID=461633 RepID=A0AAP0EGZ1_9MAGN
MYPGGYSCEMKELRKIVAGPDSHVAAEDKEDNEINQLFELGKKRKKNEKSAAEIALLVEHLMDELEVTAEEDAELNRQSKPAVNKLKKLPLLTELLSKRQLQQVFLDHGALSLLKNWLEPLPDGSLPNTNVRAAILNILTHVIMFLSRSDEETAANRKLAKDLVDKWSRTIFNRSTRFEDMRNIDEFEERAPYQRTAAKKLIKSIFVAIESRRNQGLASSFVQSLDWSDLSASENTFKGIVTSFLEPSGGEYGKYFSLPALNDSRISVRADLLSACDCIFTFRSYEQNLVGKGLRFVNVSDCFGRLIASAPDAWIDVVERYSNDYNKTYN